MRNTRFAAPLTVVVIALTACGPLKHNDVMLFGTKTKLALDAGAPPENAGVPEVSIGYKRAEFVWMPLVVNGDQSKALPGSGAPETPTTAQAAQPGVSIPLQPVAQLRPGSPADKLGAGNQPLTIDAAKYMGTDKDNAKDTYSVLASFGADVQAGASASTGAEAAVGLAQYFATGHAARILAGSGADLVNVQAPSREALKQANLRAEENLSRALTAEQLATAQTQGRRDLNKVNGQTALILDHVQATGTFDADATARLTKLLDAAKAGHNLNSSVSDEIAKAKSADELRAKLVQFNASVGKIFQALYKQQSL